MLLLNLFLTSILTLVFLISIHLMLLLNQEGMFHHWLVLNHFNTSYVVIKHAVEEPTVESLEKFQYILCCY